MDFYDVINARRTIRDFEEAPIDDATLTRILSAGLKAPSNDHMRDWDFVAIRDKATVAKLIAHIPERFSADEVGAIMQDWGLHDAEQRGMYQTAIPKQYRMLSEASCVLLPLLKQKTNILHPDSLSALNGFASIWCCIENILLAATNEGYACSLRIPLNDEADWAREVLNYPADRFLPCFLGIGKPKPNAPCIKQKDIDITQRIHLNKW